MTRYIAFGTLLLVLASTTSPQINHAPTVEQCRADQALWTAELQASGGENKETFGVWTGRMQEMTDCFTVDSDKQSSPVNGYQSLTDLIVRVMLKRQIRFIARHGLMQQFQSEDEAGAR
jgi:hypothetical protein